MPRHRMNIRWNTRKTVLLAGITLLVLAVAVGGQLGRPSAPGGSATIARPIAKPVSPATTAPPVVPPPGAVGARTALAELAAGGAIVSLDSAGHVVSVTAPPAAKLPAAGADAFTRRYAAALGVPNGSTLRQTTTLGLSQNGDTVVRYQQEFGGVPVLGGEIVVSTDSRGRVLGANAETVSIAPQTTKALVDTGAATQAGLARAATLAGREASELRATTTLWLFDPKVIGAPGASALRPTWWVKVSGADGDAVGSVLVDATDGSITLAVSDQKSAGRIVCDQNNVRKNLNDLNAYACNDVSAAGLAATTRREGQPASTVDAVNRAYDYLGATLSFYSTNFGRNSFDGRGRQARATTRACQTNPILGGTIPCPYPNAFWNGYQLVFGDGFVIDDVVGHEFTHAVTDHSSQLFYAFQSGAINEALSDIMGEFIDQSYAASGEDTSKLWLVGEDLPPDPISGIRELRDMSNPSRLGQPNEVFGLNWSNSVSDNGGVHTNSGPANFAAYLIAHGGTYNGITVSSLGMTKSKQLWYRAMHQLTSGADYAALGRTLSSACLQLVGHGFTRADCTEVNRAADATNMGSWAFPRNVLCSVGTPVVPVNDLESRTGFTLTSPIWQYIPSPDVPVRVAYSGTTALYAFAEPGEVGYAELTTPFVVPPATGAGAPNVVLRAQAFTGGGGLRVEGNTGSGWQPITDLIAVSDRFYAQQFQLTAVGQTMRLRLRIDGGFSGAEWLVDDVGVNMCDSQGLPAAPYAGSGELAGTTGTVTWIAGTPNTGYQLNLTYDPPVPGAPTSVPATGSPGSANTYTVTLPNLNPDGTYRVTIVLASPSAGTSSAPLTVTVSAALSPNCPTAPPLFLQIWTPRKPGANTGCAGVEVLPRRL